MIVCVNDLKTLKCKTKTEVRNGSKEKKPIVSSALPNLNYVL